ncbi:nad-p-binding protein [Rhizoctonia solani]|uniref:Nad-p-binding protein n=1 Tax=Rhizoctonia solani TaxID=456999 RepID=A0A8H7M0P5_9AGAM|nr:nad-p-binding protein [Rhizoctonia solani]
MNLSKGQAIAETLVQVTGGKSHIILCGRNKTAADKQCDATLMSNVRNTTSSLVERLPKLNYLVLSPGFVSLKGRDETSEGIDRKLALNYYARWKFIYDLMPLLEKAKERGEDARVLTVLSSGTGYGLKAAADSATAMNDFMVEDFAAQYPDIAFVHAHPGLVRTPSFHWSIRLFAPIIYLMSVSPADCAQWMLNGLLDPKFAKGPSFM